MGCSSVSPLSHLFVALMCLWDRREDLRLGQHCVSSPFVVPALSLPVWNSTPDCLHRSSSPIGCTLGRPSIGPVDFALQRSPMWGSQPHPKCRVRLHSARWRCHSSDTSVTKLPSRPPGLKAHSAPSREHQKCPATKASRGADERFIYIH